MANSLLALPGAANLAAAVTAAAALFEGPQWWGVAVLLGWLVWLALQREGHCLCIVKESVDRRMGPTTRALAPAGCTGGRRASTTHPTANPR